MVRLAMLMFLLWLVPSVTAAQQVSAPSAESVVVVMGEGLLTAVPDRAWITIGAESRAQSPREAQSRNTELMRPVQEKLRAAGIPADAIRTTGYDMQYEWDFVNGKRVGRGYVARNAIEVRIDTIDRVGEYLEIAVGSGATSLNGIRFDMKDHAKLQREALRMAVSDARAKADAAAAGAGRSIDRILRVDEQGTASPPVPVPYLRQAAQSAAADAAPPIAAGQVEIRARVTVTAVLK
jgi:uncharacterized protein